jgi:hypothetical protein
MSFPLCGGNPNLIRFTPREILFSGRGQDTFSIVRTAGIMPLWNGEGLITGFKLWVGHRAVCQPDRQRKFYIAVLVQYRKRERGITEEKWERKRKKKKSMEITALKT